MGSKRRQSNPFRNALKIVAAYSVFVILWISLLPLFVDADPSAGLQNQLLRVGGAIAIAFLGAQHLLLQMLLWRKYRVLKQKATKSPNRRDWGFIDMIPTNIAIVSINGHYQYWSQTFRKNIMPDISDQEIYATCLLSDDYILLRPDGHSFLPEERPLDQAMRTGESVFNVSAGVPVGLCDWTWTDVTVIPRKNAGGEILDYICLFYLTSDAHIAETELTIHTFQDQLTGLPNRSLFVELLSQAIFRMEKHHNQIGVLFLDLNRFKIINDTMGHELGNKLLIQVSKRLRTAIRQGDTVARAGGDEFIVLFEDFDNLSEVILSVDCIKNTFEEPFIVGDNEYYVGCSFGLAVSDNMDVMPAELIRDAEIAMYRAKAKESDTIEIYDQSMNNKTHDRLKIESDLRHALKRNEFLVNYQPLINLDTGRIGGWEALIRWQHTKRGLVPPSEFIDIAEETGLIIPIGFWILEEACRQAQDWRVRFPAYSESIINVNLSMRQFQQLDIDRKIIEILERQNFDPRLLKLEITESTTMKDPAANLAVMRALKALNIRLAIDDFGTGYSSLSYLKRMPVDTLKIDKSFVDELGLDDESTAIVETIISLAKALEISVTAEGIENGDQLAFLRVMGCDIGQGYHFSRPLLPADAELLMKQNPIW